MGHAHLDTTLQYYTHSVASVGQHRELVDRMSHNLLTAPAPLPPAQQP
ncbi:UNVERIFIED_ORG: hypothetical protein M2438_001103 [Methylobacterium sp. SuP10 SLI 274]|nr:hypothetical protein [Methylorubrum extorquens]MDF9862314.1 hypothetical protein [Methylorubrum pseudosasae]MDH6635928.1 hypothetical protein [Methylobacterium sp. SuP10 SLI 274]MDH6665101.1 hypothetical protein [Methylorubrum zatmanii]